MNRNRSAISLQLVKTAMLGTVLFCSVFARSQASASDRDWESCPRFFSVLLRGKSSETQFWNPQMSEAHFDKVRSPTPPSKSRDIVTEFSRVSETSKGRAPTLSADEFKVRFPHDIDNLAKNQTVVSIRGQDFMLESYDPTIGTVTLAREAGRIVQAGPKIIASELAEAGKVLISDITPNTVFHLGGKVLNVDLSRSNQAQLMVYETKGAVGRQFKVRRSIPIALSDELYLPGFKTLYSELRIGQIIESDSGLRYEVRSVGEHERGRVYLRREVRVTMPVDSFVKMVDETPALLIHSPAAAMATAASDTVAVKSIWGRIRSSVSPGRADPVVPIVGSKGFERKALGEQLMEDFGFSKRRVQITGADGLIDGLLQGAFPAGTKVLIKKQKGEVFSAIVDGPTWDAEENQLKEWIGQSATYAKFVKSIELIEILKPGSDVPLRIMPDMIPHPNGTLVRQFFDVSPVQGVEVQYLVKNGKKTTPVSVRFPKPISHLEQLALTKIADQLIENLPLAHADAQGLILLEGGAYFRNGRTAGLAHGASSETHGRTISLMGDLISGRLEERLGTFFHETGHSIAQKLWNRDFNPSTELERAVALDGKFISGYSIRVPSQGMGMDLTEEFAEVVRAYLQTDAGRLQPTLRANFPAHFAMLDRLFQVPENAAMMRAELKKGLSRHKIGVTEIAIAGTTTGLFFFAMSKHRDR